MSEPSSVLSAANSVVSLAPAFAARMCVLPVRSHLGQRLCDQSHHLRGVHPRRASATRQGASNGCQTACGVTLPPAPGLRAAKTQRLGNRIVPLIRRRKHDRVRRAMRTLAVWDFTRCVSFLRSPSLNTIVAATLQRLPPTLRYISSSFGAHP
jgi:hypothetical protein